MRQEYIYRKDLIAKEDHLVTLWSAGLAQNITKTRHVQLQIGIEKFQLKDL